MSDKISRKELKSPDRFQVILTKVLNKIIANRVIVITLILAVVVAMLGYLGMDHYLSKDKAERSNALTLADMKFNDELEKTMQSREQNDLKVAELQKQLEAATQKNDKQAMENLKKRIDAESQKANDVKASHSESTAMYLEVFNKYKNHLEGWAAALQVVAIYLDDKKLSEAKDLLLELKNLAKGNLFYDNQVVYLLISLYEQEKDFDKAIEMSLALSNSKIEEFKLKGLVALGRNYMFKGEKEKALDTFNKILKENKDSSAAIMARSYRALL